MDLARSVCNICERKGCIQTGYGKALCNACKKIYRRATDPDPKSFSKTMNLCKYRKDCAQVCSKCRLEKCFAIGLSRFRSCDDLDKLLKIIKGRNEIRTNNFLNSQPKEDLSLDEIMESGTIRFTSRVGNPEDLNSHQWANLQMVTTIEFMKTFDVMRYLTGDEITAFIKKTYFNTAIFFMAMSSYSNGRDSMVFPGNKDVFPEECAPIFAEGSIHWKLFNDIRCNLISRFIELRITEDELLILSVLVSLVSFIPEQSILVSSNNETSTKSSPFALRANHLIEEYRNIHCDRLRDYCLLKNQKNGPARFYELISLTQTVTNTMAKLNDTLILFEIYKTDKNLSKLVKGYFESSEV